MARMTDQNSNIQPPPFTQHRRKLLVVGHSCHANGTQDNQPGYLNLQSCGTRISRDQT